MERLEIKKEINGKNQALVVPDIMRKGEKAVARVFRQRDGNRESTWPLGSRAKNQNNRE